MQTANPNGTSANFQSPGATSIKSQEPPSNMAWPTSSDRPSIDTTLPARPPLNSQQSNSLPSTPYQHTCGLSFHSRSPSPRRRSTSPRSTHSETNASSTLRRPLGGCKYETAMAYFRRRMPYSIGGDLLPQEMVGLKESLSSEEEEKLSTDMQNLYKKLLPSSESDDRRRQLVQKLKKLFNEEWPGNDIDVHVFGSSGNKLCSSDSDVDICITTPFKQLENVCLLAEVLAQHGMERVVCVSHAKVPIVKIWDPQLKMACDMNVNNTLALENTHMIRTYVDVDERVRPLAMIIKYWTKRRVLNDAAFGGTLSSYTWICLIINFLQTRDPPVLPSLQKRPHQAQKTIDGIQVSFDDDLPSLQGFGDSNKQTLGELLFHFFRYYGHEFNYEKYVVSVREGKLISKEEKGWHLLQNNRLCVEEPFNTSRNLGNTADDTSFRGLHTELRRAFQAICTADLEKCCEEFVFPQEEERVFERPTPQPRPVLAPMLPVQPSGRGGRGGGRGARHSNHYGRGGNNSSRRSSSATNRTANGHGFRTNNTTLSPDMNNIHAQQAQYLLHDQLYQQIQFLQAQEQELRMQLHNQSLLTGRAPPVLIRQPLIQFSFPQQDVSSDDSSRVRAGTISHPPMAPLRPGFFYAPTYMQVAPSTLQGSNTNPSSPSMAHAVPDLRRSPRRSSVANGSPSASLRSHSQPARSIHSPAAMSALPSFYASVPNETARNPRDHLPPGSPGRTETDSSLNSVSASTVTTPTYLDEHRYPEFGGYYLMPHNYPQGYMATSLPAAAYFQTADYRPTTMPIYGDAFSPVVADHNAAATVQPVSPRAFSVPAQPQRDQNAPLIIDGSVPPQESKKSPQDDYSDQYLTSTVPGTSEPPVGWEVPPIKPEFVPIEGHINAFEIDPFPVTKEQDSLVNELTSQDDSNLNSRLGGLQLANDHESPSKSFAERTNAKSDLYVHGNRSPPKQSQPHQPVRSSSVKTNEKSSATVNQAAKKAPLSSSPTRRNCMVDEPDKLNGLSHVHNQNAKSNSKHSQETQLGSHVPLANRKDAQPASLSRKPDGLPPLNSGRDHVHVNGGWQISKKKHKRNAKSMADVHYHSHSAEPLPVDDSFRKGG